MAESAFDIWVDGIYFPQKERMGGGYVLVPPTGHVLTHSFRLLAGASPPSPEAAKYMAVIKTLKAMSPKCAFDVYCDNQDILTDINHAKDGGITEGKNKELRTLLRKVAKGLQVTAYPVSPYHIYLPDVKELARAGALSPPSI